MKSIDVLNYTIGEGNPAFVIAEVGVNHNGSFELAQESIIAAKESGADCVKFQTFKASNVVTTEAPKANYQNLVTDPSESQLNMLRKLELSETHYGDLIALCDKHNLVFSSTPYNEEDVEFLDSLDVPILKAASMHLAEPYMLKLMARTGRPLILSTGMATWEEVDRAVDAVRSEGCEDFVLLQCTTNYPSDIADANLRSMVAMKERYDCMVGYSDHTQHHEPCLASVPLGARIIEKHFTLGKSMEGPDHSTSESPDEFAKLVKSIRKVELALGSMEKRPTLAESKNMEGMRRSVTARHNLLAGAKLELTDLTLKRPATGIAPREIENLVGRVVKDNLEAGDILQWKNLSD